MARNPDALGLFDVPHPGDSIAEYLEFNGWSQRDLARRSGLTPKTVSEICNGKAPISPDTALSLERVFGRPAHFWLGLQRAFDEAEARKRHVTATASWKSWSARFPVREMRRLNYSLPPTKDDADALLSFFGVSSPSAWTSVWKSTAVSYRQTRRFQVAEEAVAAWVREVELTASQIELAPFDEGRIRSLVPALRSLTREPIDKAIDRLQSLCAEAGIAVVFVHALQHTGISGCARWVAERSAIIGLTFRYKTDDQLWFTFFHELAHILLHRSRRLFVIDNAADDLADGIVDPEMQQMEEEANRFARDTLIPPQSLAIFIQANVLTSESIHGLADAVGVGPGLVVGRLQHEGILGKYQGNALKQRIHVHQLSSSDS